MTERIRESSESAWQNPKRKKSGLVRWIFLDGNRLLLVSGVLAGVFSLAAVLSRVGLITVLDVDPITTLVGALIGGMLPFITVVLAIIQLTLAEGFGTTGTFRERLDETEEFRQNIEEHTGVELSPAEPNDFLRLLIVAIGDRVTELSENLSNKDEQLQDEIGEYVQIMDRRVDRAAAELEDAQFGTFDVISMTLDFSDAQYLYNTRHLQNDYADALSPRENEILESIETLLDDVHVARLYFKTVYMQQELVNLSRILLYVGFPALTAGGFLILMYGNLLALSLGRPFYVSS